MDDRLTLSVTHNDGSLTRWGFDEPDPANVLDDLTFGTSTPGGFRQLDCSLLRDLVRSNPDQRLFTDVKAYGPGGRIAWEGRLTQFPYADGVIRPGAVGWGAHLKDDPSLVEVYVDRDTTHWQPAALARQQWLATGGFQQGKMAANAATGGLSWTVPNEALPTGETDEAWYAAPPGITIAALGYKGKRTGAFAGFETPGVFASTTDTFAAAASSAALTLDDTNRTATLGTPARYLIVRLHVSAGPVTPSAHLQAYTALAAYGNHGLTRRTIASDLDGYYVPDMVRNIVQRWAPMLTIGDIDADTFVCPHAAFADPTDAETAISYLNAFLLWDWLVYDNKTFRYTAPDPDRLTWKARRDRGARLSLAGDDAEQQFNGVIVSYQDALGQRRIVGPPAAYWEGATAKADTTSALLVDTTTTNPINARSIPRRWGQLELSFPTTDDAAAQIGAVWLLEHAQAQRRGTITLQGLGSVQHPTQGELPTWCVRAGDYISVGDAANDVARRIISTTYTHRDRTLTADLDNTPQKLDAILERVGVNFIGVL